MATKKQVTVNIPVVFEVNYKCNVKPVNPLYAWRELIPTYVERYVTWIQQELFDNRSRVFMVTDETIKYVTKSGYVGSYGTSMPTYSSDIKHAFCDILDRSKTLTSFHINLIMKALLHLAHELSTQSQYGVTFQMVMEALYEFTPGVSNEPFDWGEYEDTPCSDEVK